MEGAGGCVRGRAWTWDASVAKLSGRASSGPWVQSLRQRGRPSAQRTSRAATPGAPATGPALPESPAWGFWFSVCTSCSG